MIDYEKFKKSLKNLEVQFENYKTLEHRKDLGELDKDAVAESVIHRFEICYDSLWNVLKKYLSEELAIPLINNSPKYISKIAFENSIITSDLEKWFKYIEVRIGTTHDYSENKALKALAVMEDFINDAIGLYRTMTGLTWE